MTETRTPAGQRLEDWWNETVQGGGEIHRLIATGEIDFDQAAQVVLDRVERERSPEETIIEGRIADALARELTLIAMPHEWWVGLARTVLARADINLQESQ